MIDENTFEYQVFETYFAAIGSDDAPKLIEALAAKYGSIGLAFISFSEYEIKYAPSQRKWAEVVELMKDAQA